MRWTEIKNDPCSNARSLSIIGDRWTMLIIRNAFMGTRRFDAFQSQLDVTRHLLTDRLNSLVEDDIINKVPYQTQPTRYEYRLTSKGLELFPVLMALMKWGDKWTVDEQGVPFEYVDRATGQRIEPVLIDGNSGESLEVHKVAMRSGPGVDAELDNETFRPR